MNTEPLDIASPLFIPLARKLLAEGRSIRFAARGTSMSPFVRDGDLLTVEPARANNLRIGDIVLFLTSADKLVAHRLHGGAASPEGQRLLVRGDNQIESDLIEPAQVLGRAIDVRRGSRARDPSSWPRRIAALAATRCRRRWRILSNSHFASSRTNGRDSARSSR
jgi:hypothetical protein